MSYTFASKPDRRCTCDRQAQQALAVRVSNIVSFSDFKKAQVCDICKRKEQRTKNDSGRKDTKEVLIQKQLQRDLGPSCRREVKCSAGVIDLLTNTRIIEVKRYNKWKDARGQIMEYGEEYPEHEMWVVLFDIPTDPKKNKIDEIRERYGKYGIQLECTELRE